jgi:hypothetical protein
MSLATPWGGLHHTRAMFSTRGTAGLKRQRDMLAW